MQTKRLGRTDLDITIVGLGTAFLGMGQMDHRAATYEELVRSIDFDQGIATVRKPDATSSTPRLYTAEARVRR